MSESSEAVAVHRRYKLSFFKILRSEWIKLFSLRSSWWLLVLAVVVDIGVCAAIAAFFALTETSLADVPDIQGMPTDQRGMLGMWSQSVTMGCGFFGQLIFIILSVLVITNEYSSGMIRSTMTAAPRRARVLIAKMVVIVFTCILVFAMSVAGGWAVGYLILGDSVMVDMTLTSDVSLRILGGFVLEMVLVSLFCFGLGAWIRSTAGAIGVAIGIIVILHNAMQIVTTMLTVGPAPTGWRKWLVEGSQFLPTAAGSLITYPEIPSTSLLSAWEGIGVLGGWTLLALVIAFIATARRDV